MKNEVRSRTRKKTTFKITKKHLNHVTNYVISRAGEKITLASLMQHLLKIEDLYKLFLSGAYYLLTKWLEYSYKKAQKPKLNGDSRKKKRLFDSEYLQIWLESSGTRLIYIEEFNVSLHTDSTYNYSLRSHPAVLISNLDPWKMSFIVVLSSSGYKEFLHLLSRLLLYKYSPSTPRWGYTFWLFF